MVFVCVLLTDGGVNIDILLSEVKTLRHEMGQLDDKMAEERAIRSRLQDEISEQSSIITELKATVATLKHEMTEHTRANSKLLKDVTEGKIQIKQIARGTKLNAKLEEEMVALKEHFAEGIAAKNQDIEALKAHIVQYDTGPITFFVVSHDDFGPVTVNTKVPFPVENVNIGGGWQPHINAFQAPVAGHYFFFASTSSNFTNARTAIVHTDVSGDHIIASLLMSGSGGHRQGDANAAIIYLEVDEYVSVQLLTTNTGTLYSSSSFIVSTFSGFLLIS